MAYQSMNTAIEYSVLELLLLYGIALQIGLIRHEEVDRQQLSTVGVESNLEPLGRETNFIQPGACSL